MTASATLPVLRLAVARASAWALLLTGWVGLGSVALALTPSPLGAFALVAAWLLALGLAATVATRDRLRARTRRLALLACAALGATALLWAARGAGVPALLAALLGWAGLTALASGVVRSLRLALGPGRARPPVGAASLGALAAVLALGDLGELPMLALRLDALLVGAAVVLAAAQPGDGERSRASCCRAGLFDCSLPAWPAGAWHDLHQWPTLLAGLAMLPMMAALPLMTLYCRAQAVAPQAMVALHFAAMFGPALLWRRSIARWSPRTLAAVCAACLGIGALAALWAPPPWDLLGLAFAHGAAWGLAWAGQLWAPDRRGRQGTSALPAAVGYAALTLAFGVVVDRLGAAGVGATHAALGLAACAAWLLGAAATPWRAAAARWHHRADRPVP